MKNTAILKNSPTVRETVPSGHFEKKGPPPSYFLKRKDAKHIFFYYLASSTQLGSTQ